MISAATPVAALDLFIVGNGYRPLKPIYAIRTGAAGELALDEAGRGPHVAWSTKSGGPYLTTPLVYGDLLYVLAENAVLTAYHAGTGERVYRQRVGDAGARFTASPVAAGGRIYLAGEDGEVYVVQAGLEYRELAVNPVGEQMMATPAIAGGTIVLRGREPVYGIGG
jgi:outer membrane protein assembly factor BamB